jgi:dihydrofolate reductase
MGQAILTETQQAVIAAVAAEPRLANFYLSGGTALAGYYLRHRLSDDLNFLAAAAILTPPAFSSFAGHSNRL